ncbi:MAG: monofunctional biosynthetic peptidoglycan transglycosylase, partial [Bacteroidales bacterium]|nr:monofunctional biosynthetic peptidoglycan transglycosylase [Bacteroidales bacterium]
MKYRALLKNIGKVIIVKLPIIFLLVTVAWVLLLKWIPVYFTPLMAIRSIEYWADSSFKTYKRWQPIERISPNLVMGVMAAED